MIFSLDLKYTVQSLYFLAENGDLRFRLVGE